MAYIEFSRPGYWSGWPFPSPGGLPNPGIKARSPTLQVDFPDGSVVRDLPANAGDMGDAGLIPGSGRSPEEENGNPL